MKSYKINRLMLSDLPRIAEIEKSVQLHPWNESLLLQSFDHLSYNLALRADEHYLMGYLFCRVVAGEAELLNISIDSHFQHQGWGEYLLGSLLEQLKEQHVERLMLEVRASNQPALRLYKRLNFGLDGIRKNYYPLGETREDAILMSRQLQSY